jgi:hypothetical protein
MNNHFPERICVRLAVTRAETISAREHVGGSTAETLNRAYRSKKVSRGREQKIPGPTNSPMAAAIEFE